MKNTLILIVILIIAGIGYYYYKGGETGPFAPANGKDAISVMPIEHASGVLTWGDATIYMDPVGDAFAYDEHAAPNIAVVTHTHGDHLNTSTLAAVSSEETAIIAPQAVADELPETSRAQTRVLANGETANVNGFSIKAVPMYNLPESDSAYHTKGEGNGYVIERDDMRVYIAGDTGPIPEMRALENITIAFVPMNLPYTMNVEDAADAVRDFAPKQVYPYHYRNQDGTLSDIERFRTLVSEGTDISVVFAEWYPNR